MARRYSEFFDVQNQAVRVRRPLTISSPGHEPFYLAAGTIFTPAGPRLGSDDWLTYDYLVRLSGSGNLSAADILEVAGAPLNPYSPTGKPSVGLGYYDLFLQNSLRGQRYRIVLLSGESAIGVPTTGSMANPADPSLAFLFKTEEGAYRVPFRELQEATRVDFVAATLRAIDYKTASANDLLVEVPGDDITALAEGEGLGSVRGKLVDGTVITTPAFYKVLTAEGFIFLVNSVAVESAGVVIVVLDGFGQGDEPWV